ncbi:hypothetical protein TNCV_3855031 [Trichonephila clavipes]|nr:hypothetical protein TNCV_3855031 [Trichonephila clavipes]
MTQQLSPGYEINSKQVALPLGWSAKVPTKYRHLHRITTWHYAHDDIGGYRLLSLLVTLMLYLEEEFPSRQPIAILQRMTFSPASSLVGLFDWIQKSKCIRQRDSRRVFTWREKGGRFHPFYVTKIDRFGGTGILVCGGINCIVGHPCAISSDYIFMDDNAWGHTELTSLRNFMKEQIFAVWTDPRGFQITILLNMLGKAISQCSSPPRNPQEVKVLFLEKWAFSPQILIDILYINNMVVRCVARIAVHCGHTPY